MKVFKIADHNLQYWQNRYNYETRLYELNEVQPGMRVCAISKLESLAVITHVGPKTGKYGRNDEREYVETVTVLWLTGPRKGTVQTKMTNTIAHYDAYRAEVMAHVAELDALEAEAAKTGL